MAHLSHQKFLLHRQNKEKQKNIVLTFGSQHFILDISGALYWQEEEILVLSDLHLEQGMMFARNKKIAPPFKTGVTLDKVENLIHHFKPRKMITFGDIFNSMMAAFYCHPEQLMRLNHMIERLEGWLWIADAHDKQPQTKLKRSVMQHFIYKDIIFSHRPLKQEGCFNICGSLHPVAIIQGKQRKAQRKCFIKDHERLMMPSFGALKGGLDVLNNRIKTLFRADQTEVFLLAHKNIHPVKMSILLEKQLRALEKNQSAKG